MSTRNRGFLESFGGPNGRWNDNRRIDREAEQVQIQAAILAELRTMNARLATMDERLTWLCDSTYARSNA